MSEPKKRRSAWRVCVAVVGWTLVGLGVLIVVFSQRIVFPGLERLIGIETIVGSENVVYEPDGSYMFTNPGAMIGWILCVAGVGLFVVVLGVETLLLAQRVTRGR